MDDIPQYLPQYTMACGWRGVRYTFIQGTHENEEVRGEIQFGGVRPEPLIYCTTYVAYF